MKLYAVAWEPVGQSVTDGAPGLRIISSLLAVNFYCQPLRAQEQKNSFALLCSLETEFKAMLYRRQHQQTEPYMLVNSPEIRLSECRVSCAEWKPHTH
ncbi:hypothetical protein PAMP_011489 [Pampus punctatissimus]